MPSKKEKLPLSVTHPELAKEADGWDPSDTTLGSNKVKDWVCKEGHRWASSPNARTSKKGVSGCPFCSGHRVAIGFNDLSSTHPEIASEAYEFDTRSVTAGSRQVASWKCKRGHIFEASIYDRTSGKVNCGYCSGKKVLQGFNDLQTLYPNLALEADGWDSSAYTSGSGARVSWVCSNGHRWQVSINSRTSNKSGCPTCTHQKVLAGFSDLKTTHPEIAKEAFGWNPEEVFGGSPRKLDWKCSLGHIWSASPHSRCGEMKSGCPICGNRKLLKGFNDLMTLFPDVASEADGWNPSEIVATSSLKKNWVCSLGHKWSSKIFQRTLRHTGCPVCTGQALLTGFNDLGTTHPEIAKEAHGWDATKVSPGAMVKKAWICPEGHKWKALVSNRSRQESGCPTCSNYGFDPNEYGFLYFIQHSGWQMFQIGITNDPTRRLKKHSRLGWELLEIRGPMDGHLTQQWETAILRMLKAKGADLSNDKIAGKFDGYSEAWSKSTFEVKSIKELMRLTEEFEESKLGD